MKEILAELNNLVGIRGSCVIDEEGQILAEAWPDSVEADSLSRAARLLAQTFHALGATGNRVSEVDLLYGSGRLIVKILRNGALVLFCDTNLNLPLMNLNASASIKKLSAELKSRDRYFAPAARPALAAKPVVSADTQATAPTRVPETIKPDARSSELQKNPPAKEPLAIPDSNPVSGKDDSGSKNQKESSAGPENGSHSAAAPQASPAREGGPLSRRLSQSAVKPQAETGPIPFAHIEVEAAPESEEPSEDQAGETQAWESSETPSEVVETWGETPPALIPEELREQDHEAKRLVEAATRSGVTLRAFGTLALRWHCHEPHPWLYPPDRLRTLEFCGFSREAAAITKCLSGLGYQSDERLNKSFSGRRLCFNAQGWWFQVQVFLDTLDMYQHLDVAHHLKDEPLSLSPTYLFLARLQSINLTDAELLELAALCLDHELRDDSLAPEHIDLRFIRNLCADDWGWFKSAEVNLPRLAREASAWLNSEETKKLDEWVTVLRDTIDKTPKSIRWRLRAVRGNSQRWYHMPEQPGGPTP